MPSYDALCLDCGTVQTYQRRIAARDEVPDCELCGKPMRRTILTAPMGFMHGGNFEPFKSQVDGSIVRTQRELDEHNRRNSVISINDVYDDKTLFSENFADKARKETKLDKKERVKDVVEAIKQVEAGYKPQVESIDG